VTAITDYLAAQLLPADEAPVAKVQESQTQLEEIAVLSDEEAEAMLLEELNEE
jgi:hypothetical protein